MKAWVRWMIMFGLCVWVMLSADGTASAAGTNYYVAVEGDDVHDGLSRETAFAGIQRGVDALAPGDTLIIAPGEYFGAVSRTNMGGAEAETVIRAEIPGTVLVRGDVLLPEFRKVDGYRFVYAADFDSEMPVLAVKELDTLSLYSRVPNIVELDFQMGGFFTTKRPSDFTSHQRTLHRRSAVFIRPAWCRGTA